MEANGNRLCKICNQTKPLASFYVRKKGPALICILCERRKAKDWYYKNRQKSILTSKQWKIKNKEYVAKFELIRGLKRRYNITLADAEILYYECNNQCQICGKTVKGRDRAIDHDHKTGKVRGLLCRLCNVGLGAFHDSVNKLEVAIKYLKKLS